MIKKFITIIVIFITSFFSLETNGNEGNTTCSEEMRSLLKDNPNAVILKIKGLVCSSCAIGVRVHLSKMDGVDTSKFNKGVLLDSSSQLVLIAVNEKINFNSIQESIINAGYDLHHLCYIDNGSIKRINFNI